jgi:hypothetical protein
MPVENPAGVPIVGPGSPYITPEMLINAPTGIAWQTIPDRLSTPAEQLAEQLNICVRASGMANKAANQTLRATVDVEPFVGPGEFRCQIQPNGVTRLLTSRSPVLSVVGARISSATTFPRNWQTIPVNQLEPEKPLLGIYNTSAPSAAGSGGAAILLAPGWVTWANGRMGSRIETTYINGWPHGSLIASSIAGASTLHVDDITGWAGAAGTIYDGADQEFATCTTVTPDLPGAISGPGVLHLATPLAFPHQPGTLVTCMPSAVQQACIYYATAQALTRGATATAVQSLGGGATGGGAQSVKELIDLGDTLMHSFIRVI